MLCLVLALRLAGGTGELVCHPGDYKAPRCPTCESLTCFGCPAGKYSANDADACAACPAGKYTHSAGTRECLECRGGMYQSSAGAKSCRMCAAGTFGRADRVGCESCPAGKHATREGSAICTLVVATTTTLSAADTAALAAVEANCGRGTYAARSCVGCSAFICLACPAGRFHDGGAPTATSCDGCPRGKWQGDTRRAVCVGCEAGRAAGTRGRASGAVSESEAGGCDTPAPTPRPTTPLGDNGGAYLAADGTMTSLAYNDDALCLAGKYWDRDFFNEGPVQCYACPPGQFQPFAFNFTKGGTCYGAKCYAFAPGNCTKCAPGQHQRHGGRRCCFTKMRLSCPPALRPPTPAPPTPRPTTAAPTPPPPPTAAPTPAPPTPAPTTALPTKVPTPSPVPPTPNPTPHDPSCLAWAKTARVGGGAGRGHAAAAEALLPAATDFVLVLSTAPMLLSLGMLAATVAAELFVLGLPPPEARQPPLSLLLPGDRIVAVNGAPAALPRSVRQFWASGRNTTEQNAFLAGAIYVRWLRAQPMPLRLAFARPRGGSSGDLCLARADARGEFSEVLWRRPFYLQTELFREGDGQHLMLAADMPPMQPLQEVGTLQIPAVRLARAGDLVVALDGERIVHAHHDFHDLAKKLAGSLYATPLTIVWRRPALGNLGAPTPALHAASRWGWGAWLRAVAPPPTPPPPPVVASSSGTFGSSEGTLGTIAISTSSTVAMPFVCLLVIGAILVFASNRFGWFKGRRTHMRTRGGSNHSHNTSANAWVPDIVKTARSKVSAVVTTGTSSACVGAEEDSTHLESSPPAVDVDASSAVI